MNKRSMIPINQFPITILMTQALRKIHNLRNTIRKAKRKNKKKNKRHGARAKSV